MFRVVVGHSDDPDSQNAIAEVLQKCSRSLAGSLPQAGILFTAIDFDHVLILQRIQDAFPEIELIGGTTNGEISSILEFQQDSLTLMLFATDEVEIHSGIGRGVSKNPALAAQQAIAQAKAKSASLPQLCFTFPDSLTSNGVLIIDLEFLEKDAILVLHSMNIGTERIRDIVLSLRNFSRLDESEFKAVDVHEGIDNTLMILQHRLKATDKSPEIQVIRDYGNLSHVECYAGQLNQVFMNILVNALDALEEFNALRTYQEIQQNPSRITICTSVVNSQWVKIAIADNGSGIPESIQKQIFNPFFTTKPVGKGTGMGMAISYQIITKKHCGKLEFFSTPGKVTEFVVQIPIQQKICLII
ncbi:ATP-binding protein [Nostoc sp. LPT]|uniref:ATP-binding protein n=1 Tax=Nostoc sp. LPT TaxID=2815387 RepID=UPI001DD8B3BD|nr:ATP-binding protein [Nostoc sp. LPT]MBN4007071.1 sensor histidine kinase [Nostoc sp. LPT]